MFNLLEISEKATKLSIANGCLSVQCTDGHVTSHSFNDLNAIILATPAVSLSGFMLYKCAQHRIPIVSCDETYSPVGIMLPLCREGAEHDASLEAQLSTTKPFAKQLWKSIITSKIKGQHNILLSERNDDSLACFLKRVTSGDDTNIEAHAARIYWKKLDLFPKRDRFAKDANLFFNYVYTVIYSAFARYICSLSLHPHIGIHHHNQYDPFCLASDLMEPYRPFADRIVLRLLDTTDTLSLTRQNKEFLLQQLYSMTITLGKEQCPFFNAIRKSTLSFKSAILSKKTALFLLPELAEQKEVV